MAQRWNIDIAQAMRHAEVAETLPLDAGLWQQVFARPPPAPADVDEDLYGGFLGNADRRTLQQLRALTPERLAAARPHFDDMRLEELVFRFQARNFPDTLDAAGRDRWEQHRAGRLFDGAGGARTVEMLFDEIDRLSEDIDERGEQVLGALYDYAETIAPERV